MQYGFPWHNDSGHDADWTVLFSQDSMHRAHELTECQIPYAEWGIRSWGIYFDAVLQWKVLICEKYIKLVT